MTTRSTREKDGSKPERRLELVCESCGTGVNGQSRSGKLRCRRCGLREVGLARRTRYLDLTLTSFTYTKSEDGRRYARFWDDGARRLRYVYRYRWVWEQAHGPIPDGVEIHHKNGKPWDDRLENLELKWPLGHAEEHRDVQRRGGYPHRPFTGGPPTWVCVTCGTEFSRYRRNGEDRKYCSLACRDVSYRVGMTSSQCAHCSTMFEHKTTERRRFCSRTCFNTSRKVVSEMTLVCGWCLRTFSRAAGAVRESKSGKQFCSIRCSALARGSTTSQLTKTAHSLQTV